MANRLTSKAPDDRKKNVWITGASSGIGRELALQLARDGHFVIVSGRSIAALETLKAQYPRLISCVNFDITDEQQWRSVPDRLAEIVDQLDLLIMAAGVCEYVDDAGCPVALYKRVFEVNFFAAVSTLSCALPFLRRSDNGPRVAGVGSLSAQVAFTRAQAYGASKSALEYWLDCQRLDLHQYNIGVTVISPGFVDTPMTKNNDFSMPAIMPVQTAAALIIAGLERNRMYIRFPRRLYWPLRLARGLPKLWFGRLADRLQRSQSL